MNDALSTVRRGWPTRPAVTFQSKAGEVALDQIRTVDKTRLVKRLGEIDESTATNVLEALAEMFAR